MAIIGMWHISFRFNYAVSDDPTWFHTSWFFFVHYLSNFGSRVYRQRCVCHSTFYLSGIRCIKNVKLRPNNKILKKYIFNILFLLFTGVDCNSFVYSCNYFRSILIKSLHSSILQYQNESPWAWYRNYERINYVRY